LQAIRSVATGGHKPLASPSRTAPPPPPAAPRYDRSIVEGPLARAVWRLAWPTMLVNIIGGMQSLVDQVLVGHIIGFTGNAAIGVSNQVFIAVFIFITSVFIGMSVLVSRFAGAGDTDKVNRTVYQACITAIGIALLVMAPAGYFLAPSLLDLVNAAPAVQAQALPFLRIMFMTSSGMLIYFMVAGALRSAGDARTPMILGFVMTALNIAFNVVLIRGLGPIPSYGTAGAAMGTALASGLVATYAIVKLWRGGWVEYHGRYYDFGPLQIEPAPTVPVPIWVGGHSQPALRRAATFGDGWIGKLLANLNQYPCHDRIDPACDLGEGKAGAAVQSPGPHLRIDPLQGVLADRGQNRAELPPVLVPRPALPEREPQEGERGVLVRTTPLPVLAVDDPCLAGMQLQPDLLHSAGDRLDHRNGLDLTDAVHDRVIDVTLELDGGEFPRHPRVERIMQEQISQHRRNR
jgi:hypothetical protein